MNKETTDSARSSAKNLGIRDIKEYSRLQINSKSQSELTFSPI